MVAHVPFTDPLRSHEPQYVSGRSCLCSENLGKISFGDVKHYINSDQNGQFSWRDTHA